MVGDAFVPHAFAWLLPMMTSLPAYAGVMSPCVATSPTGTRWVYVQPQHTASATVQPYLHDQLGITSCGHGHFPMKLLPISPAARANITFAFSFVANPFKRIVSAAGFFGVINGQRHHNHTSHADDVAHFRSWLYKHLSPEGTPKKSETMSDLYSQADMLSGYPTRFVGCQSNLASHLYQVLKQLGYALPQRGVVFAHNHCAASCGEHRERPRQPQRIQPADWFDRELELRAIRWFAKDFYRFNFSMSSSRMQEPCGLEPQRLGALLPDARLRRSLGSRLGEERDGTI
jgi:hypothetical protein